MSDLLVDESLSVLRIGLEIGSTSADVRMRLRDAVPFDRGVDCDDFGFSSPVPVSSDAVRLAVPEETRRALHAAVAQRADPDAPLWLEFVPPYGALAAVPWERDLVSLDVPVLRLPPLPVPAAGRSGQLRAVIIASAPRAKTSFGVPDLVARSFSAIQRATDPPAIVDVFIDADRVDGVESAVGSAPAPDAVRVHRPTPSSSEGSSSEGSARSISVSTQITSPWLQWVLETIGTDVVDIVQFICPGYRSLDSGALALARTPSTNDDSRWARVVGANELTTFLRATGAWFTQLTDATGDEWTIGLRLLVDQLAQLRPGTAALLDPSDAGTTDQLRFLLGAGSPRVSGDVIYCHPALVKGAPDWASILHATSDVLRRYVEDLTIATDAESATSGGDLAAWIGSAQRLLEERTSLLLRSATSAPESADYPDPSYTFQAYDYADGGDYPPPEEGTSSGDTVAAERGAADAIQFVASLVAAQARVVS